MSQEKIKEICLKSLEDSKAEDILSLDIEGISSFADTIIIATATSNRHAKSISEKLIEEVKTNNLEIIGNEGTADSGWILVDCGSVVINLMKSETREFYDLEGLWGENTLLPASSQMLLNFISVTNKLSKWESEGVNYYSKQLPNYVSLNFEDIKSQQHPKRSVDEVVSLESKSILSKLKDSEFTISFDIKGESVSSEKFSQIIKSCIENNKKANFIIGGSFGLSDEILNSSNKIISISEMTFPHRLFKIILMEQIYRAFSILNNSPYHK